MVNPTPEQVQAAVNSLRELWCAGHRSLRHTPPEELDYGDKTKALQEEGEREHLNPDTIQKARRFAQEYKEKKDLDELCRQVRHYEATFSATHMIRLLSIPLGKRQALFRDALRQRWTTSELDLAIREQFGRRRQGGRRPRVPKDQASQLSHLDALSLKWLRWCEAAAPSLPPKLREQVANATRAVRRVHDSATETLERLRSSRKKRRK